jgi:hypothetical protein
MTNFSLKHHHGYTFSDIENLLPWEKEVYVAMLLHELEKERNRLEEQARK